AVDTVIHINDVSDGNTNPETITRTYRVTDTSGNYVDVTQTITVTGAANTVFASLPTDDVCVVSDLPTLASLPADDDNSVPGSWAVVDNLDDTHTYTFTPTDTDCYNPFPFTVTVTGAANTRKATLPTDSHGKISDPLPPALPASAAVACSAPYRPTDDVCVVSDLPTLASLPADDDNSVPGSWAVVDNLDDTHTYTFTPTDTDCYNPFPFTVTVTGAA